MLKLTDLPNGNIEKAAVFHLRPSEKGRVQWVLEHLVESWFQQYDLEHYIRWKIWKGRSR